MPGEVEDPTDELAEFQAGDAVRRGQVENPRLLRLRQVEEHRGCIVGVGRRHLLVGEEGDGLAPSQLVDYPADAVLLSAVPVPAVEGAHPHDRAGRKGLEDCGLPPPLGLAVHAERPRFPPLLIGPSLPVENVVRGDVQKAGAPLSAKLRHPSGTLHVHPLGRAGMVFAVVDSRQGRAEDNVLGGGPVEGLLKRRGIRQVRHERLDSLGLRMRGPGGGPDLVTTAHSLPNDILAQEARATDHEDSGHGRVKGQAPKRIRGSLKEDLYKRAPWPSRWGGCWLREGRASSGRTLPGS